MEGLVTVEITGGQGQIVSRAEGQYYEKNGHVYVLFTEDLAEDGKKGKATFSSRLKISDDEVILRRSLPEKAAKRGAHVMEFIYRKQAADERGCMVDYPTPYGIMKLEIRTKELQIDRGDDYLVAKIGYAMLQEGQEIICDGVKIVIRK